MYKFFDLNVFFKDFFVTFGLLHKKNMALDGNLYGTNTICNKFLRICKKKKIRATCCLHIFKVYFLPLFSSSPFVCLPILCVSVWLLFCLSVFMFFCLSRFMESLSLFCSLLIFHFSSFILNAIMY